MSRRARGRDGAAAEPEVGITERRAAERRAARARAKAEDDGAAAPAPAAPGADEEPARLRPTVERPPDRHEGQAIVVASWAGTALFGAVSVPAALVPDTFAPFLIVVSLVLFVGGTGIFAVAYLTAIGRSREVLIGMGGLFFLAGGTAPQRISRHLVGSFATECVLAVVTAVVGLVTVPADVTNPVAFGVLAPIWGLGLIGLWAARYGTFAPRPPEPARNRRAAR